MTAALRLDVLGGNVPAERLYAGQWFERRGTVRMFCADTGCTDYGLYEYLLSAGRKNRLRTFRSRFFAYGRAQYALMGSESSSCPFSTERMTMS